VHKFGILNELITKYYFVSTFIFLFKTLLRIRMQLSEQKNIQLYEALSTQTMLRMQIFNTYLVLNFSTINFWYT
jgi:hypothetical protein